MDPVGRPRRHLPNRADGSYPNLEVEEVEPPVREPTPEQKLRHVLGMVRASRLLLHRALGAQVVAAGWSPGQPLPERMQRIKAVEDDLQRALEALERVVAEVDSR